MIGNRMVEVIIRRNKAARRVSLRLTPAADGVVLTLPMRTNIEKALTFLHQKITWLEMHMAKTPTRVRLEDGGVISVLGKQCVIVRCDGRGVTHLTGNTLVVYGEAAFTARRVRDFLKKYLREVCLLQARDIAMSCNRQIASVRVGEMRSRWGSCTVSGALAFNWRLVFAPFEVVRYVVAHEVAHLTEMNHSSRFWEQVSLIHPEHRVHRAWLRREGHHLYRYQ